MSDYTDRELSKEDINRLVLFLPTLIKMRRAYKKNDFSAVGGDCPLCERVQDSGIEVEKCRLNCVWGILEHQLWQESGNDAVCNLWARSLPRKFYSIHDAFCDDPVSTVPARISLLTEWIKFIRILKSNMRSV